MYQKSDYLKMIDRFNRMTFSEQMETIKANPNILKLYIAVDIVGATEDFKDEIKSEDWFIPNYSAL